ncbi:SemiSWEET transporter [Aquimarina addita]|uniref:SemiSWEET transporter n=1 Tax=Aquimarina addita TaxID=870485 RepID=A0ABP7XH79_9FLAO
MTNAIEILGFVAATLTTAAFLPQVYQTWRTKNAQSLSLYMLLIFFVGVLSWLVYGVLINSMPVIVANVVTAILTFMLLFFKYTYKN